MARGVFRKVVLAAAAAGIGAGTFAGSAVFTGDALLAQGFSPGYEFLKAVRDREGDVVMAALNEPGSVVVNTRELRTGQTALHIVTQRRDTVWIRFLTARGANPNIEDQNGVTPIQIASNLGFAEGVELLINAGARVDSTNASGETPLISAVHQRDVALARLLLSKGANPDHNDNSGRSAREYASLMTGNTRMVDAIEQADETRSETSGNDYGPSF